MINMNDFCIDLNWLREQNPEEIHWGKVFQYNGWTEELIREYSDFMNIYDWAVFYCYHSRDISIDFAREYRNKLDLHTRDGKICIN